MGQGRVHGCDSRCKTSLAAIALANELEHGGISFKKVLHEFIVPFLAGKDPAKPLPVFGIDVGIRGTCVVSERVVFAWNGLNRPDEMAVIEGRNIVRQREQKQPEGGRGNQAQTKQHHKDGQHGLLDLLR